MGYAHNTTEISSNPFLESSSAERSLSFPFWNVESNQFVCSQSSSVLPTRPLDTAIISSVPPHSTTDVCVVHLETPNAPHHGTCLAKCRQVQRGRGIYSLRDGTRSESYLKSIEPSEESRNAYKDYDLEALNEHILKTKISTSIAMSHSRRI